MTGPGAPTIEFCLRKYGPTVTISEVLEILGVGKTELYAGIKENRYPKQRVRGKWSTEAVARAAVAAPQEEMQDHDEGL